MTSQDVLNSSAAALVDAANAFHHAAERPGSHVNAAESLGALQTALRHLSGAWYRVAADAVPSIPERRAGRSREQEVVLVGALHDAAAAFTKCARACRESEVKVAAVIDRTTDAAAGANAQLSRERAA